MKKNLFIFAFVIISLQFSAHAQLNSGLATVLIDMQEGFYERDGTTNSQGLRNLFYNQKRLLTWSVQNNIPVLIFEYVGFGKTHSKLMKIIQNHKFKVI